jgi:hypothetical protein
MMVEIKAEKEEVLRQLQQLEDTENRKAIPAVMELLMEDSFGYILRI